MRFSFFMYMRIHSVCVYSERERERESEREREYTYNTDIRIRITISLTNNNKHHRNHTLSPLFIHLELREKDLPIFEKLFSVHPHSHPFGRNPPPDIKICKLADPMIPMSPLNTSLVWPDRWHPSVLSWQSMTHWSERIRLVNANLPPKSMDNGVDANKGAASLGATPACLPWGPSIVIPMNLPRSMTCKRTCAGHLVFQTLTKRRRGAIFFVTFRFRLNLNVYKLSINRYVYCTTSYYSYSIKQTTPFLPGSLYALSAKTWSWWLGNSSDSQLLLWRIPFRIWRLSR